MDTLPTELVQLLVQAHEHLNGNLPEEQLVRALEALAKVPPIAIFELLGFMAASDQNQAAFNRIMAAPVLSLYVGDADRWFCSVDIAGLHELNKIKPRSEVDRLILGHFVGHLAAKAEAVVTPAGDEYEIVGRAGQPNIGVWLVAKSLAAVLNDLSPMEFNSLGAYVNGLRFDSFDDLAKLRAEADPKHKLPFSGRIGQLNDHHLPVGASRVTVIRSGSRPGDEGALLVVRDRLWQTSYQFPDMAALLRWLETGPQCLHNGSVPPEVKSLTMAAPSQRPSLWRRIKRWLVKGF